MEVKKGKWVEIHDIILQTSQRAHHLPEDTKQVPLEMRVKGFLLQDAKVGERVKIRTLIGRVIEGELTIDNPRHEFDYGEPVPELLTIGTELKSRLFSERWKDHE
ncbi:conserved hypothetical protein [Alkaliphilus metalliredigens QYMF]|uniref:2-amino-4-ketopentanoate thiolase, alpha subunit n=1 Tax=Alkaliphilus metalliredigens (strain QYMF) TaxID=293826 RepID=A6TKL7_ALKMQ|nr:2-amino-4-oxopentanoate thiolase subunit OrtA [Alkaliphilus metalliredigens]ABR46735.1 conserved hypothetical protein [Alkaliphilus metalliredigens QYMF]